MLLADKVMAIDTKTLEAVRKYAPEVSICYVPNPFDMSKIKNVEIAAKPNDEVVFVDWVIKTKGVEELLEAWKGVHEKHPDWLLRIVGPCNEAYKQELSEKYPCENVIFEGEKKHDEVLKILSECSVFTLPSYTEGFPNAVLEAMALGKAIVATRVGAIPEMLCGCGVTIEPENAKEIEIALIDVMEDENLRRDISEKAKEKLNGEYTIEKVFETYKKIWEEIFVR